MSRERKQVPLRLDPAVHDALARWAADELRSLNAQIEIVLRRALDDAGRMPKQAKAIPRRGRPPTRAASQPAGDLSAAGAPDAFPSGARVR